MRHRVIAALVGVGLLAWTFSLAGQSSRGEAQPQNLEQTVGTIAHITVGVADLDRALSLWVGAFQFEVIARRKGPDADLARLWNLKPDRIVDQAYIGTPGVKAGRIHLVQFADPDPPVRRGAGPTDLTPKNLDVACRDLPARYNELLAAGHRFRSPWVDYKAGTGSVREVQMPSHDDVNVVLIEGGSELPYTPAGYAGVTSFITVVADADAEEKFYTSVIGLTSLSKQFLSGPGVEKMVGLPAGAGLDVRLLGLRETRFSRVELVQYKGITGAVDRYPQARPPALGTLLTVFNVPSLKEFRARADAAGVKVTEHGRVTTIFGTGAACSVRSPAGLRVEIHERPGS